MRQCFDASRRSKTTRSGMRMLRASGQLPGVVYGGDKESIAVTVSTNEMQRLLRTGRTELIDLNVEGTGKVPVILADIQRDRASGELIHVDFQQVRMNQLIRMKVPIEYVGTAAGTKLGGVLQTQETQIEVEGLPTAIPPVIQIDITELGVGAKLFVEQVDLPGDIVLVTPPDQLLASITVPRGAKEEEEEEAAEASETA